MHVGFAQRFAKPPGHELRAFDSPRFLARCAGPKQIGGRLQSDHIPVQVWGAAPIAVKVLSEARRVANSEAPGQFRLTART